MAWTSAFRTLLLDHPEIQIGDVEVREFCRESAQNFVNTVFADIDTNGDGSTDFLLF